MPQVNVTKVLEGESQLVLRLNFLSDGSGELVQLPVFTPAACVPQRAPGPAFRLVEAWYGMVWFDVLIGFGTLNPTPVWTVARDADSHINFDVFGGLADISGSPPSDGVMWVSTNGFSIAGSFGTLVLSLRKLN